MSDSVVRNIVGATLRNRLGGINARNTRRRNKDKRVGIVDVGSNSVRLVIFDGLKRVPLPLFNEKVLCGLGKGLAETGMLNHEGVELAFETITRFRGLADAMGVGRFALLATAAAREAENGPVFIDELASLAGQPVTVLSGEEEARYAALGILSGFPHATGVAGDLGGGSLELVELIQGRIGVGSTLPLGPLRMAETLNLGRQATLEAIDAALDELPWFEELEGCDFFPVGGAWRNIAKLHMEQHHYPLHMVHGYVMSGSEAIQLAELISHQGRRSLSRLKSVSKRRQEVLPYASLLMHRILMRMKPRRLVFSSYGLREGWLYENLEPEDHRQDPLIAAVEEWAQREGRFGDLGQRIAKWCAPLFVDEQDEEERLRLAVCHLSDLGWRYHPDYRPQQAFLRILRAQELCVLHRERAFIALALYARYGGSVDDPETSVARSILKPKRLRDAEVLGRTLRVAYTLSGGAVEMLEHTSLRLAEDEVTLAVPSVVSVPTGQALVRRMQGLADALGVERGYMLT